MTYRLRIDPTIHGVYRSLPVDARRALGGCLLDAMNDPLAHSEPYGYDDGTWRSVGIGYVTALFTIDDDKTTTVDDDEKFLTVVHITYAG